MTTEASPGAVEVLGCLMAKEGISLRPVPYDVVRLGGGKPTLYGEAAATRHVGMLVPAADLLEDAKLTRLLDFRDTLADRPDLINGKVFFLIDGHVAASQHEAIERLKWDPFGQNRYVVRCWSPEG